MPTPVLGAMGTVVNSANLVLTLVALRESLQRERLETNNRLISNWSQL